MQERAGGDDDGGAVGVLDGGAVFHDRANVDHVLTVFVDGAAQEADERFVGHDLLGDGVDEEAGVDRLEPLRSMVLSASSTKGLPPGA